MAICVPEVVAVNPLCTYEGCYPEDSKVQKILDWPDCNTFTEVQGFLGVCCIIQIWVKDFAKRAKPLVVLTKKDVEFFWGQDQKASMEDLKQVIITAHCLWTITQVNVLFWWSILHVLPPVSFSYNLVWPTSITQGDLVQLLGMRGNRVTLR